MALSRRRTDRAQVPHLMEGGPVNAATETPKRMRHKIRPRDLRPGDHIARVISYKDGMIEYEAIPMVEEGALLSKEEQLVDMVHGAEHYTAACRLALDILGEVIPQVNYDKENHTKEKLGVVEDILTGAVTRYTDK